MTDYPVGEWINWKGGPCPVHPKTVVRVLVDGEAGDAMPADTFLPQYWKNGAIEAFKIITPYRGPREVWVVMNGDGLVPLSVFLQRGLAELGCPPHCTIRRFIEAPE